MTAQKQIKILIACERSARVRDAFFDPIFDVWSCDTSPSDKPGKHFQGNVLDYLYLGWHAIIAFPPCTYLSRAGNANWLDQGRATLRASALRLVADIWDAPTPFICIENPQGILSSFLHPPSQIIHPYYFGEHQRKRTCLWLQGFPPLLHAPQDTLFYPKTHVPPPAPVYIDSTGKARHWCDSQHSYTDRQVIRSKTFTSVAEAMASQWSPFLINHFCKPQLIYETEDEPKMERR